MGNHCCNPNVNRAWAATLGKEVFHATRVIQPGEELCISFIDEITCCRTVRRNILQERFKFFCQCQVCSLQGDAQTTSDARREEFDRLDRSIAEPAPGSLAVDPMERVNRMLVIIEEEFFGHPRLLTRAYYFGYQLADAMRDLEAARSMLKGGLLAHRLAEGDNNDELTRDWNKQLERLACS